MPIGVPRIIYCWGEEVPAQWTDIYNFIFRRRMVFLMQYLDDELCNQICGLLINIHMEDRSKELEKKETEKSGIFKSGGSAVSTRKQAKSTETDKTSVRGNGQVDSFAVRGKQKLSTPPNQKWVEDLLISEEDLQIEQNYALERHSLQRMTLEWLNWHAPFFDYSEEPYLFYLAEILSKDFGDLSSRDGRLYYESLSAAQQGKEDKVLTLSSSIQESDSELSLRNEFLTASVKQASSNSEVIELGLSGLLVLFKNMSNLGSSFTGKAHNAHFEEERKENLKDFDVYLPFRKLSNLLLNTSGAKSALALFPKLSLESKSALPNERTERNKNSLSDKLKAFRNEAKEKNPSFIKEGKALSSKSSFVKDTQRNLIESLAYRNFSTDLSQPEEQILFSEKALTQKELRREYKKALPFTNQPASYLNTSLTGLSSNRIRPSLALQTSSALPSEESYMEYREYYRKQTESALQEEEAKKVFMIINSFGGSVGNGITIHDALQFIKAGSLTLALGVAASAASLALAGGSIGERYVTEGCHTMLHQPEGGLNGQASDIWIDSKEIMKIRLDVAEIYALSTYRPRHKILRDLDRDFYLNATETIQYGLADEIATNEIMHEIISMTSQVWDYHDTQQQRLLESRESLNASADTQTQN
uniref:proteolytic subunit 2 of clp protease n=1 Tax=Parallela transversalis TaxID=163324 RepID=UPI0010C2F478|nr:proteolytic subunit 2 of clp protease [Parallela transversalis]AYQ22874.1 proteolytic subunit 2 of clp protease [Parallela transversalis]